MSRCAAERKHLPHFVYRYYDADGVLLYIGVTYTPTSRQRNHSYNSHWFGDVASCRMVGPFLGLSAGTRARRYEATAIFNEQPLYNRQGNERGEYERLRRMFEEAS